MKKTENKKAFRKSILIRFVFGISSFLLNDLFRSFANRKSRQISKRLYLSMDKSKCVVQKSDDNIDLSSSVSVILKFIFFACVESKTENWFQMQTPTTKDDRFLFFLLLPVRRHMKTEDISIINCSLCLFSMRWLRIYDLAFSIGFISLLFLFFLFAFDFKRPHETFQNVPKKKKIEIESAHCKLI